LEECPLNNHQSGLQGDRFVQVVEFRHAAGQRFIVGATVVSQLKCKRLGSGAWRKQFDAKNAACRTPRKPPTDEWNNLSATRMTLGAEEFLQTW
jgi:hypothetical protein